jgi:hypothetical protein
MHVRTAATVRLRIADMAVQVGCAVEVVDEESVTDAMSHPTT